MKSVLLFLACLATAMPAAWSNSAPVFIHGIEGANIVPIKNTDTRMIREIVNIDCAWTTYSVQADFWFKNISEQEHTVIFGFPIDYISYEFEELFEEARKSCGVTWNGKPIAIEFGRLQNEPVQHYRQWIYWTVKMAPKEEATNRVSYTFPTWNMDSGDKGDSPCAYLKYILKTGAAWAGPIDSSIIRIRYGTPLPPRLLYGDTEPMPRSLTAYPQGYVIDNNARTFTWEFKNFIPDKNIYFGWGAVPDFSEEDKEDHLELHDFP